MPKCEFLDACAFFNDRLATMPSTAELFKKNFCLGEYEKCARYLVASKLGRENVPPDLFPNQLQRAQGLIRKA